MRTKNEKVCDQYEFVRTKTEKHCKQLYIKSERGIEQEIRMEAVTDGCATAHCNICPEDDCIARIMTG